MSTSIVLLLTFSLAPIAADSTPQFNVHAPRLTHSSESSVGYNTYFGQTWMLAYADHNFSCHPIKISGHDHGFLISGYRER